MDFPDGPTVQNPPTNAEDVGLIPGLGRSPGGGNSNPLQYSLLGNLLDRGNQRATDRGVAKESEMQDSNSVRHDKQQTVEI